VTAIEAEKTGIDRRRPLWKRLQAGGDLLVRKQQVQILTDDVDFDGIAVADGQSHNHDIRIDLIAYSPLFYQQSIGLGVLKEIDRLSFFARLFGELCMAAGNGY
jgi:hypothetical protein